MRNDIWPSGPSGLLMSEFQCKYKKLDILGKGRFAYVMLVKDEDGKQMAMKKISKNRSLEEYFQGEKACLLDVNSPYIMKLYSFAQNEKYKYLICQYCNGGDLLNQQTKQKNNVFPLDTATQILSYVIRGLEYLHEKGYIHRNVKSENILIKYEQEGQNKKSIYKLADFVFSKKIEDVKGTVLGTEHYMSPEIYTEKYGFQVDIWAFGVLFYFMLNNQYPFQINSQLPIEKKRQELMKQAVDFSYTKLVKKLKLKKRLMQNCTDDVEDFFQRIFDPEGQMRIGWGQIRKHPVFKKHFPIIPESSEVISRKQQDKPDLYINKQQPGTNKKPEERTKNNEFMQEGKVNALSVINRMKADESYPKNLYIPKQELTIDKTTGKLIKKQNTPFILEENIDNLAKLKGKKANEYPDDERHFIEMKYEKIKFLYDSEEQMTEASEVLSNEEILSLRYCLLRYYLILLGDFLKRLNVHDLTKEVEKYKWDDFLKTKQFKKMREEYQNQYDILELSLVFSGRMCENFFEEINQFNEPLCGLLEIQFSKEETFAQIKKSYRTSTQLAYSKLRKVLKKGNKYLFLTVMVVMCHAWNKIMEDTEDHLKELLAQYITDKEGLIDFSIVRSKLTSASEEELSEFGSKIYKAYF